MIPLTKALGFDMGIVFLRLSCIKKGAFSLQYLVMSNAINHKQEALESGITLIFQVYIVALEPHIPYFLLLLLS